MNAMTRRTALAEKRKARLLREARYKFDDSFLGTFRPTEWVQTYVVDPAGGEGIYTTLEAARDAVTADDTSTGRFPSPWCRRRVLIRPGVYDEALYLTSTFVDWIGESGNRDDVLIQDSGDGNKSVLTCTQQTTYLANFTVKLLKGLGGWNYRGACNLTSAWPLQTVIFENMAFICEDEEDNGVTSGGVPNGSDGFQGIPLYYYPGGASTYFAYRCHMAQANPDTSYVKCFQTEANTAINENVGFGPAKMLFLDCETTYCKEDNIESGSGYGQVFCIEVGGDEAGDVFAWVGGKTKNSPRWLQMGLKTYGDDPGNVQCHYDHATICGDPLTIPESMDAWGFQQVGPKGRINLARYNSDTTFANMHGEVFDLGSVAPVNGCGAGTDSFYLPNNIGTAATHSPTTGETSAHALVAGRAYFVPIAIAGTVLTDKLIVNVTTSSAAKILAGFFRSSQGVYGQPSWYIVKEANQTSPYGVFTFMGGWGEAPGGTGSIEYPHTSHLYGTKPAIAPMLWACICPGDATAEFTCAQTIEGDWPVCYQDWEWDARGGYLFLPRPTTTPLPEGDYFPVLSITTI